MGFFDRLFRTRKADRSIVPGPSGTMRGPAQHSAGETLPPSPQRVLARSRVLAALVGRATLEQEVAQGLYPARENERIRRKVLRWVEEPSFRREFEPEEYEFLGTPVGRADPRSTRDALWRAE